MTDRFAVLANIDALLQDATDQTISESLARGESLEHGFIDDPACPYCGHDWHGLPHAAPDDNDDPWVVGSWECTCPGAISDRGAAWAEEETIIREQLARQAAAVRRDFRVPFCDCALCRGQLAGGGLVAGADTGFRYVLDGWPSIGYTAAGRLSYERASEDLTRALGAAETRFLEWISDLAETQFESWQRAVLTSWPAVPRQNGRGQLQRTLTGLFWAPAGTPAPTTLQQLLRDWSTPARPGATPIPTDLWETAAARPRLGPPPKTDVDPDRITVTSAAQPTAAAQALAAVRARSTGPTRPPAGRTPPPPHPWSRPMTNDTGDLWSYVDRLTRPRKQRLTRQLPGQKKSTTEWITIDSLLDQLEEMVGSTTTKDEGGAKGAGSPAPLNVVAATLLDEMSRTVIRELKRWSLTPRIAALDPAVRTDPGDRITITVTTGPPAPPLLGRHPTDPDIEGLGLPLTNPDDAGRRAERAARLHADAQARAATARHTHDLRADLRQLATFIADQTNTTYVDDWVYRYRTWVSRVETALTLDDEAVTTRGIRYGDRRFCPTCGADKVTRVQDDEVFRDPALVATFRDGQLLHVTCRVCETGWWRGEGLDELGMEVAYPTTSPQPAPATAPQPRPAEDETPSGERLRLIHLLDLPGTHDTSRSSA